MNIETASTLGNPRGPHCVGAPVPAARYTKSGYALVCVVLVGIAGGCVRRTIVITTEPAHALVFLNDQEVGRGKVSTDFLWYGDYDVIIREEGYQTLKTHWDIKPPWYQVVPIDFVAEVLWPGRIHDVHTRHFVLEPRQLPTSDELVERAFEMRERTLNPAK